MAEVRVATTLAEALELLAGDPASRPLAGGVGVLLGRALSSGGLGSQLPPAGRWVDVRSLPELAGIRRSTDGRRHVGAAVTIAELAAATEAPGLLRAAAAAVGNPGVRAMATVGGNLVEMGASSDLMAALVALGAVGLVDGPDGERRLPVGRIPRLLGAAPSAAGGVRPALLLRVIELEDAEPTGWGFERLTFQGAMDRSAASVAVALFSPPGRSRPTAGRIRARIAATAIADRVVRFGGTERRLAVERWISDEGLEAAASADLAAAVVRGDARISDWYRRAVVPVLVRRAIGTALDGRR